MSEGAVRKAVGEAIAALIADAETSQAALAADLKIRAATVSDWVRGRSTPSLAMIRRIEAFCEVPLGSVLRRAGLVEDPTLEDLVAADGGLDEEAKEAVMSSYLDARKDTLSRATGRPLAFGPLAGYDPMSPMREALEETMRPSREALQAAMSPASNAAQAMLEETMRPVREMFSQMGQDLARQVSASIFKGFQPAFMAGIDEQFRRAVLPNLDIRFGSPPAIDSHDVEDDTDSEGDDEPPAH